MPCLTAPDEHRLLALNARFLRELIVKPIERFLLMFRDGFRRSQKLQRCLIAGILRDAKPLGQNPDRR